MCLQDIHIYTRVHWLYMHVCMYTYALYIMYTVLYTYRIVYGVHYTVRTVRRTLYGVDEILNMTVHLLLLRSSV